MKLHAAEGQRALLALLLAAPSATACVRKGSGPQSVGETDGSGRAYGVQAACRSAGTGDDTLSVNGGGYPLQVDDVGLDGVGASTFAAAGDVYGLNQPSQSRFSSSQGRYGFALGTTGPRDLSPKNSSGASLLMTGSTGSTRLVGDVVAVGLNRGSRWYWAVRPAGGPCPRRGESRRRAVELHV